MKLYFRDTDLMYCEISELLTRNLGPASDATWQNGAESTDVGFCGYVEIYADVAAQSLIALAWRN